MFPLAIHTQSTSVNRVIIGTVKEGPLISYLGMRCCIFIFLKEFTRLIIAAHYAGRII